MRLEELEDRSLLSVTIGLPVTTPATPPAAAQFDAVEPFLDAAATQLEMVIAKQATQGEPVLVSIMAFDSLHRFARSYSGSIALMSTDGNIALPQTIGFVQGIAYFHVTFNTLGLQRLSASDNSPIPLNASATTTVTSALTATHFAIQLPNQVSIGAPTIVQLTALDSRNRIVTGYAATVSSTSTDPNGVLPGTINFNQGVATFQVTFNTSSTQRVTFTDNSSPPISITASTFVAAPATQLEMVIAKQTVQGEPVLVSIMAFDSLHRFSRNYAASIALTSTDPSIVLPQTIGFVQGTAFFQVTFNTAGVQRLSASDNSPIPLSASASTTVTSPLTATRLAIQLPTQVSIGVPTTVQLTALDSRNRLVTDYAAVVNFSSTDPLAALPGTIRFSQGIASFQVIFNTSGSQSVTFTDNSSPPLTISANTFVVAPASQLEMVMVNQALPGVPVLVSLMAFDSLHRFARNYSASIALTSTDPSIVLPQTIGFFQGIAYFHVTFNTAGVQRLSASDNSPIPLNASATTTVSSPLAATHFAIQLPTQVSISVPTAVRLTALDSRNQIVTGFADPVSFSSTDPNFIVPGTINFNQGVASFQVIFNTSGSQNVTFTDNTSPPFSITANTFVAAPATQLEMVMVKQAVQGVPVLVSIMAFDSAHRFSRNYSASIALTSTDPSVVLPQTIGFVQGIAYFHVTFNTAGVQRLSASDNSPIPLSASATTTVTSPSAATHFALQIPSLTTVGIPTAVQLTALDSRNRIVTDLADAITTSSTDPNLIVVQTINFTQGLATFQVIFNTPGPQTITFADNTSPPFLITANINVLV